MAKPNQKASKTKPSRAFSTPAFQTFPPTNQEEEERAIFEQWGNPPLRSRENRSQSTELLQSFNSGENHPLYSIWKEVPTPNQSFGSLHDISGSRTWYDDTLDSRGKEWDWNLDVEKEIIGKLGIDDDHPQPSESLQESISQLAKIGFPPALCAEALDHCHGDLQKAAAWLHFQDQPSPSIQNGNLPQPKTSWAWVSPAVRNPPSDLPASIKTRSRSNTQDHSEEIQDQNGNDDRKGSHAQCKFFANGYCRSGDKCPYNHIDGLKKQLDVDVKSRGLPCKFYISGGCRKGDKCPYSHVDPSPVSEKPIESKSKKKEIKEILKAPTSPTLVPDSHITNQFSLLNSLGSSEIPSSDTSDDTLGTSDASSLHVDAEKMAEEKAREEVKKKKREEKKKRREAEQREREERERKEREIREKEREIREKEREAKEKEEQAIREQKRRERKEREERERKEREEKEAKEREERERKEREKKEKKEQEERERKERERKKEKEEKERKEKEEKRKKKKEKSNEDDMPDLISDDEDMPGLVSDDEDMPDLVSEDESENFEEKELSKKTWFGLPSFKTVKAFMGMNNNQDWTPKQKSEALRIREATDHYQVLNLPRNCSTQDVKDSFAKLSWVFSPIEEIPSGAVQALSAAYLAHEILKSPEARSKYDKQLSLGKGKIHPHVQLEPVTKGGIFWGISRIIVAIIGFILVVGLIIYKIVRGLLRFVCRCFSRPPRRRLRWCENCKDYHGIQGNSGELWEESGRYYYKRSNNSDHVHDVTDFVENVYGNSDEISEDAERRRERVLNSMKGRRGKKKKVRR